MSKKALPEPKSACQNCANYFPVGGLFGRPRRHRCATGESAFNAITGKDEPQFRDAVEHRKEHPERCPDFTLKGPSKGAILMGRIRSTVGGLRPSKTTPEDPKPDLDE